MGRPSLKEERISEILDAYEACVARYGVDGATLERVARKAGLARPLIRHNVGNRDDLLDRLIDRFLRTSHDRIVELLSGLPKQDSALTLIDRLFDGAYDDQKNILVAEALIAAAVDRPELAGRLNVWIDTFVSAIAKLLRHEFKEPHTSDIDAVAAGITGIYFNVESLAMLGNLAKLREASKKAATMLVSSLQRDE
jgi:AcrR family transcriptional regulator